MLVVSDRSILGSYLRRLLRALNVNRSFFRRFGITIKMNIQCQEDLVMDVLRLQLFARIVICVYKLGLLDEFNLSTFFKRYDVFRNSDVPTNCS
ncbi:hypothetical protein TNCV_3521691 [Trichonephila clavipes]|nr:hypothetical protein TNCV_3521691 [Trichonephila clavipes]